MSDRRGGRTGADSEKRESLVHLRDQYVEAQKLVTSEESHANLEWILGGRRNVTQDPLGFEPKTIEIVALWLQDLASEIDRRIPPPAPGETESDASPSLHARNLAQSLRDATQRFLTAFRESSQNVAKPSRPLPS